MSKRKDWMTAEELMNRLGGDAEYQARRVRQKERRERREADLAVILGPVVAELNHAGFEGGTLEAIVAGHAPIPTQAVEILLLWLRQHSKQCLEDCSIPARAAESVVRALAAAGGSFSGQALAECFECTNDEGLRWAIANTVALANPHSIDGWLSDMRRHPYWGPTLRALGAKP